MKKILIAGFGSVGKALVPILSRDLYSIIALKRSPYESREPHLTILKADLCDTVSLSTITKDNYDYLLYCPSPDKRDEKHYQQTYLKGLQNLLEVDGFSNNLKRIIFISSTSVYGQKKGEWVDEESPTLPENFSGRIILETEKFLLSEFEKESIILRFGGIYGKKRSRYIDQIQRGDIQFDDHLPKYINRIHIEDCAASIKHLLELKQPQKIYLGVDDDPADQKMVISWLTQKLNIPLPPTIPSSKLKRKNTLLKRTWPFKNFTKRVNQNSNKRCKNRRLKNSGYVFLYPTYKEGYSSLLK